MAASPSRKLIKAGLPDGELGRIAIAVAPSRPNVVYATVESKKSALYRSDDLGQSWSAVNATSIVANRPFYFSVLVVDPKDYNRLYKPGSILRVSKDGGRTFTDVGFGLSGIIHPDHHALWVDPLQPSTIYAGTDGGVFKSTDYGGNWTFLRNLPVEQFYHVTVDQDRPYNVYGGLQDNGSWMGPTQGRGDIPSRSWTNVGIGDGFNAFADPSDRNTVYAEWQNGKLTRFDKVTGKSKAISPYPHAGEPKYRFNWNTPAVLSPTDPKVIYLGAQFLFRSRNRGESWERISDHLTTNNPEKQKQEESGGLTIDNSSAENHCTIYAISESPLNAKVLWVGTDDGNLQLTRDGGKTWKNLIANVTGAPKEAFVSSIETSRHQLGTAYVTFDNHQQGDMRTYVFRTTDFGMTWTPLATSALRGYAHIVREDLVRPNLLFLARISHSIFSFIGWGGIG